MWTRSLSLLWNIPLHGVNICCCDWFNKKDDWPIVRQDEERQENQTKETRKKKGGI